MNIAWWAEEMGEMIGHGIDTGPTAITSLTSNRKVMMSCLNMKQSLQKINDNEVKQNSSLSCMLNCFQKLYCLRSKKDMSIYVIPHMVYINRL